MTPTPEESDFRNQTIIEHLVELRERLIKGLYGVLVGMVACWSISERIFDLIRAPITPYLPAGGLYFTSPMDKFLAHIKISLVAGVILSSPFWVFQAWKFVSPGLYRNEKKYALGFVFSGTGLFCVGIAFAYFAVLPMAFKFLMTFGGAVDQPFITINDYLSFVSTTALAFGVSFELPLVLVILGLMGIINQQTLKDKRRYAIVGIAIVSAIITPPDLLSMMLMLVPMWALYEISVLLVGLFERKKNRSSSVVAP